VRRLRPFQQQAGDVILPLQVRQVLWKGISKQHWKEHKVAMEAAK
jgi:hypothetical protein